MQDIYKVKSALKELSSKYKAPIKIQTFNSGKDLLENWKDDSNWSQILILEMDMADIDAMTITDNLRQRDYKGEIVFYTCDKPRVFESFDVEPFHYILKDTTPKEKTEEILLSAIKKLLGKEEEYMTFNFAGEFVTVKLKDIKYILVDVRICILHYGEDKTFRFYSTLNKLEQMLIRKGFVRINGYTLVNMAYIKRQSKKEVEMKDGSVYTIGRSYKAKALKMLGYYFDRANNQGGSYESADEKEN